MDKEDIKSTHKSAIPPYISYRTFINFIQSLQQGIPSRIDRSLMSTMSGAVQIQLITTLRYFDLITPNGLPTDKLSRFVKSEGDERKKILKELIASAYPFIFKDGFDLKTATTHQLEEKFKNTGASGETVRKCFSFFFTAAKDAEISISPYIKKYGRTNRATGIRTRKTSSKTFQGAETEGTPYAPPEDQSPKTQTLIEKLLEKFPSFDPSWPDEIKIKWFDDFDQLTKRVQEK